MVRCKNYSSQNVSQMGINGGFWLCDGQRVSVPNGTNLQIKLGSKCNVLCRDYYCYLNHNLKLDPLSFFVIIIFNCIIVGIIIIPVIIIITKYIEIIHKIIITLLLPFFMVINIANDIALITDIIISSAVMVLPC